MTIDTPIGQTLDRISYIYQYFEGVLKDKAAIADFVNRYNAAKDAESQIPSDYFGFLEDPTMMGGRFIEKMAKYGDPSRREFALPLTFLQDPSADFSFTGFYTAVKQKFFKETKGVPVYERELMDYSFKDLLDLSASI